MNKESEMSKESKMWKTTVLGALAILLAGIVIGYRPAEVTSVSDAVAIAVMKPSGTWLAFANVPAS